MRGVGFLKVETERVAKLETEVEKINRDVGEIKSDIRAMRDLNLSIEKSLAKLSHIAEQQSKIEPRVTALERMVTRFAGGFTVALFLLTFFSDYIKRIFN